MAKPTVTTLSPTNLEPHHATLHGNLALTGGKPCQCWFEYHIHWGVFYSKTPKQDINTDNTQFQQWLPYLNYVYQWEYKACAQNADGYSEGDLIHFWLPTFKSTIPGPPWLSKTYYSFWLGPTLVWTLITDIPAHLSIRVGDKPPWKKRGTHKKRGIVMHHDPIVNFPYQTQLEQTEPGDSIEHTFNIPFAYSCQTLWWYAYGTVDKKPSPSISPFYHYHYQLLEYDTICYTNPLGWPALEWYTAWEVAFPLLPTVDHLYNKINLWTAVSHNQNPASLAHIAIYQTFDNYKPYTSSIVDAYFIPKLTHLNVFHLNEIYLKQFQLITNIKYAIVLRATIPYNDTPFYGCYFDGGKDGLCQPDPYPYIWDRVLFKKGYTDWRQGPIRPLRYQLQAPK